MTEQTYFSFDARAESDIKPTIIDVEKITDYWKRLNKYYTTHQDECGHGVIKGDNTKYGNCGKVLTKEDRYKVDLY